MGETDNQDLTAGCYSLVSDYLQSLLVPFSHLLRVELNKQDQPTRQTKLLPLIIFPVVFILCLGIEEPRLGLYVSFNVLSTLACRRHEGFLITQTDDPSHLPKSDKRNRRFSC